MTATFPGLIEPRQDTPSQPGRRIELHHVPHCAIDGAIEPSFVGVVQG
jgi:hypothetical protein